MLEKKETILSASNINFLIHLFDLKSLNNPSSIEALLKDPNSIFYKELCAYFSFYQAKVEITKLDTAMLYLQILFEKLSIDDEIYFSLKQAQEYNSKLSHSLIDSYENIGLEKTLQTNQILLDKMQNLYEEIKSLKSQKADKIVSYHEAFKNYSKQFKESNSIIKESAEQTFEDLDHVVLTEIGQVKDNIRRTNLSQEFMALKESRKEKPERVQDVNKKFEEANISFSVDDPIGVSSLDTVFRLLELINFGRDRLKINPESLNTKMHAFINIVKVEQDKLDESKLAIETIKRDIDNLSVKESSKTADFERISKELHLERKFDKKLNQPNEACSHLNDIKDTLEKFFISNQNLLFEDTETHDLIDETIGKVSSLIDNNISSIELYSAMYSLINQLSEHKATLSASAAMNVLFDQLIIDLQAKSSLHP